MELPQACNQILLRHAVASKRNDYHEISALAESGFYDTGSSGAAECITGQHASDRWTVIAHIDGESWFPLYTSQSAANLFDVQSQSKLLEVVYFEIEANKIRFKASKKGKLTIELEGERGKEPSRVTCPLKKLKSSIDKSESSERAFAILCDHFEIPVPFPIIRTNEGIFEVIGKDGKPVINLVREHICFSGHGIEPDTNEAAELMNYAVETCNPEMVQEAIDEGAPLEQLPKTSLTPLAKAMGRGRTLPSWKQCAELLIDAGASLGKPDRWGTPFVVKLCETMQEDHHLAQLVSFLLEHGVDVNEPSKSGRTAITCAALEKQVKTVEVLLGAGASTEVTVPSSGRTLVEEITDRRDRELRSKPERSKTESEFDKILALLTSDSAE